ncbi:hypothetical protein NPIL_557351 [Nephila pilipes]|uniref:Uncharacterized protein n=1 Tax=Nephila pilipes TaxID=299642 RepID=A0A8X6Q0Z2_NEPPI|nr:hypothetical protein NPIL_557351 [Nephila pilipes]
MPHHSVYRPEKTTTKFRVVFNISSETTNGISFNNLQINGVEVQDDLISIMMRFHKFPYAYTADNTKNVQNDKHSSQSAKSTTYSMEGQYPFKPDLTEKSVDELLSEISNKTDIPEVQANDVTPSSVSSVKQSEKKKEVPPKKSSKVPPKMSSKVPPKKVNKKDLVVISCNLKISNSLDANKPKGKDDDVRENKTSDRHQRIKKNKNQNNVKKTTQDVRLNKSFDYQNISKSLDFAKKLSISSKCHYDQGFSYHFDDQWRDIYRIATKKSTTFADALRNSKEKKGGWIYQNDKNIHLGKNRLFRRQKTN